MVRRILLPTLETVLGVPLESNPSIANYNRGDMKLTFTNTSTLWMGSLDDPERAEGPNIDFIHVDEARLIKKFKTAWQVIQRRLRGSGRGHPVRFALFGIRRRAGRHRSDRRHLAFLSRSKGPLRGDDRLGDR